MKIHIVCAQSTGDHILARFARILADGLGWSLGPAPSAKADLNYFFPYLLMQDFPDYKTTKTAAWFTHRDTLSPEKSRLWDRAAQSVNIRLTTAPMYAGELALYGKTAMVSPPLDLDKFKPIDKDRNRTPRIGVSGFTYGDGRKGEKLVSQLYSNWHWNAVEWRASGRGWPMKTVNYAWDEMETFYQHIDIYLCAALIEGIPMPPLEALACGTPVVIPAGVGMLDDLPEGPGIWRYKAGDLDSMGKALKTALEGYREVKPEWLREAVSQYSIRRWVEDHGVLLDEVETPLEETDDLPPYLGRAGVVYVAYGGPARDCVIGAMQSWKQYMPQIPIALISSEATGIEDIFIQYPDRDVGARWAKTVLDSLAPPDWDYVLYLDADTQITADISFLFQALQDGWDWIICRNPDKYHTTRRMIRPDNHDECEATFKIMGGDDFLQLNGGVFAYRRNDRTRRFWQYWHEEWQRWGKRDQAALLRALWRQPLRLYVLGNEWNTVTRYNDPEITAGILHYPTTARRHGGMVNGRLDSPEAWSKVIK